MKPGTTLGRWQLVREHRDAPIGRVFLATAAGVAGFDRTVELVIVDPAIDDHVFDAWAQRARAAAAIGHPGLVGLLDIGRSKDGTRFVATEHVEGATAAELVAHAGALAPGLVVRIAADLAAALAALGAAGQPVARLTAADVIVGIDGRAHVTGTWGGGWPRPRGAAPEPREEAEADPRDGVHALGAVLWELAAGAPGGALPSEIPSALRSALERALAPDPAKRPRDTSALVAALPDRAPYDAVADLVRRALAAARAPAAAQEVDAARDDDLEQAEEAPYSDDNVQFTVYRPRAVTPGRWYPFLAFAHLAERRDDAPPDEPDPVAEVERQAEQVLGDALRDHRVVTADARAAVPREGEITFVPEIAGVMFNPPRRSFLWEESVHREEFRMRADASLDGKVARGRLTVLLGRIVLADVSLSIRVQARPEQRAARPELEADHARPYRRIFASYSHRDAAVVSEIERYARSLGDEYIRDWVHLRTGEVWNDRLRELIGQADIFQLFWSHNSMRSPFVRQEWEYALSLGRASFVRPTYWEDPMPAAPDDGLPPEALLRLHFQRIHAAAAKIVQTKDVLAPPVVRKRLAEADREAAPPPGPALAEPSAPAAAQPAAAKRAAAYAPAAAPAAMAAAAPTAAPRPAPAKPSIAPPPPARVPAPAPEPAPVPAPGLAPPEMPQEQASLAGPPSEAVSAGAVDAPPARLATHARRDKATPDAARAASESARSSVARTLALALILLVVAGLLYLLLR